eukprot:m.36118 g.36118  ORF g.36118 m.36118 type:complete len:151 (+) comp10075_c0_seq1:127-579(+)
MPPFSPSFSFEGEVDSERRPHGEGKLYVGEAVVYHGEFVHGAMTGVGFRRFQSGASYNGEMKNGVCEGMGVWMSKDMSVVKEGSFVDNQLEGMSCKMCVDGKTFTGAFHKGKRHGFVTEIACDGDDNTKTEKWVNDVKQPVRQSTTNCKQ